MQNGKMTFTVYRVVGGEVKADATVNATDGIGTALHEAPEIPNYEVGRKGVRLRPGMTLAIEPMINIGTHEVDWLDDDWTVVTRDGSLSAHYENTILITEGEPRILSLTCENE